MCKCIIVNGPLGPSESQAGYSGFHPKSRESWNEILYLCTCTRHKAKGLDECRWWTGQVYSKEQQHRILGLRFRGILCPLIKGTNVAAAWLTLTTVKAKEGAVLHNPKNCKAAKGNKGMTQGIWEDINPVNKKGFKDD